MFQTLQTDIQAVFDRDPAARSVPEVVLCYPGLHAVWGHRLAHWLWQHEAKLLGRFVSHLMRGLTGIEIHPAAEIGSGLLIDHGMGVVIGETAEVGDEVTLYHGVTLGGTSLEKVKRHPTIGDRVVIGAGAKILGPIEIGADSRIGANAVVVDPVPPDSVVVGVPAQVIKRGDSDIKSETPDLDHGLLPDLIGATLSSVVARLDAMEQQLESEEAPVTAK